ncbi:CENPB DNA-binding domain containing protein 1-like 16 [Homarus americanus]|uniref:CENPB DNA-binding domain containing protein 1-like 16 n=1 Tax=Homarus americanus TaxID=6706 RepID=A0A8J5MTM4_HOMAM|nr:CENPB DNA-binding domain containing protein 1-like 16 [Homarus americanus]
MFDSCVLTMSEVHNVYVGSGSGGNDGCREGQQGKPQAKREYHKGVKKRKYTLEMKREMLEMIKSDARTCEIMRRFNCPESTIRSFKKNKEALTASVNIFSRFSSSRMFSDASQRNLLLVITEHYLHKWVEKRNREQGDLSGPQIRHQARVYYSAAAQKKRVDSPPPFNASVGWLPAFKKCYEVKFARYREESASADNSLDSDQALPINQEEEMVDDLPPNTSPPRNREVLSVCEFWKKYNIKNAVDRIVEAWRKINFATVLHTWKPLFANSKVSQAEQTEASGERQSVAATLMDTVEAARSVPAPGFSDVQVEDLQEIIGQHQQQPTIEEMLEDDEEQEEQQPTQEDDVKPGEPITRQLTELLTNIACLGEQLEEYDTRPQPRNLMCSALDKGIGNYKALYMSLMIY